MKRFAFIAALLMFPFRKLAHAAQSKIDSITQVKAPPGAGLYGFEGASSEAIAVGPGLSLAAGVLSSVAPAGPIFVVGETPTANVDGSFNLAFPPVAGSLILHHNGLREHPSVYTLAGQKITFSITVAAGAALLADYRR